jgi:hypothetical protein
MMMMMINAFQIEHKKRITEKIDTKCVADCGTENRIFNQAYIGN